MHQSFEPPPHPRGKAGVITSYSPACVSLGGGVNTCFHFFVAWFTDGLKSSGGGSEQMTLNCLKIRLTFSFRLVIWTFDVNYLRLHSRFLLLEMLNVWREDLRKAVTADSTQGTLVCTAEYQGVGTSLSIFAPVFRNFTGFHTHTAWMSPPCPGWGFKWLVHNCVNIILDTICHSCSFKYRVRERERRKLQEQWLPFCTNIQEFHFFSVVLASIALKCHI